MPASSARRSFLVGLMALALAASSAAARESTREAEVNPDNYFVVHPGPANDRTGVDPFDAYAPVDSTSGSLADDSVLLVGQFTSTTAIAEAWSPPPSPTLPGRPY